MTVPLREIKLVADAAELAREAAETFVRLATEAVAAKGSFSVALSGGSTPKALFGLLAGEYLDRVPWRETHFFWGDERHVPPDHPDSNYRMTREAMLSTAPVPPENVHRVEAENPDAADAADAYGRTLERWFGTRPGEFPRVDLVLLGMGPDGHTASLFPHTTALHETARSVVANWVPKFDAYRITLTAPVLNNAANVLFLVAGADKAEALHEVHEGARNPDEYPSQLVRPTSGSLRWLVDRAAAARLLHFSDYFPPEKLTTSPLKKDEG
jgi:6-phosphogluconolactonase